MAKRIYTVKLKKTANGGITIKYHDTDNPGVVLGTIKDVTLCGEHTWEEQCHRGDPLIYDRHLAVRRNANINHDRFWGWWGPNDYNGDRPKLRPLVPSATYITRLAGCVAKSTDAGIVASVMLFRANETGVPFREYDEDETISHVDMDYLDAMIEGMTDEPIIWEVGNEMPRGTGNFQESVIAYLKANDPHGRSIIVNTSKGTSQSSNAMSWEHLSKLRAQGFSHNPGAYDEPSDWTKIFDTDHNDLLQTRNGATKVAAFEQAYADGFRILLHMMAFEDSILNGHTNAHDPDNPSIAPVRGFLGAFATPLPGGKFFEDEEEPPPDPPEDLIDMVELMAPSSMEGFHMGHKATSKRGVFHDRKNRIVYVVKNKAGDTWDVWWYDDEWIYLWVTEKAWNTPHDYKRHHPGNNVRFCPRFARPGYPGERQVVDTTFTIATACVEYPPGDLAGGATEFHGPFRADNAGIRGTSIGGDVPNLAACYTNHWLWNDENVLEEYVYAVGYGGVQWTSYHKGPNGSWVVTNEGKTNNLRLAGGAPEPFFPCFDIPAAVAKLRELPPTPPPPPPAPDKDNDSLFLIIGALVLILVLTGVFNNKE